MICEFFVGIQFHSHSMIADALFRLSEIRSSNISFLYFSSYQKKFTENQLCWAAKSYLMVGLVQFLSMGIVIFLAIETLSKEVKDSEINEILPLLIVVSICILFTITNIYLYIYSDGINPPQKKKNRNSLNYLNSAQSSDLEDSAVMIQNQWNDLSKENIKDDEEENFLLKKEESSQEEDNNRIVFVSFIEKLRISPITIFVNLI